MRGYLVAIVLALGCIDSASAVCPIFPTHYSVGVTATDNTCNYNDVQSAIAAVGSCPVVIDITPERSYLNQHLSIAGKNVTLQGWGAGVTCAAFASSVCQTCGPNSTAPLLTLDGGSSGGPVLSISGDSHVNLQNLTITHGNAGAGDGGGIAYSGSGSLALGATTVSSSQAANGAGIEFNGNAGSAASLTLGANTLVIANTASGSGGGIRVEGNARLYALQAQTWISSNHAPNGYGGGIQVLGPALADIGSRGYGSGAAIFYNDAMYGGGIAASATGDTAPVQVRLFSTDAQQPVRISQNSASHTGGGIWLKSFIDSSGLAYAQLCAMDFRIDGNIAQEGTAIYGDSDNSALNGTQGSIVDLLTVDDAATCATPESVTTLGAVHCSGSACNTIDGNVAEDLSANPTPGATILVQNQGHVYSTALALRGNSGAHAVRTFDTPAEFDNCLAVDGAYSAPVFQFENQGQIVGGPGTETLRNCTIANNSIGSGAVIASAYGFTLHDSIVAEPGIATLDYTANAGDLDVKYVVSNSISTLPGGNDVMVGVPTFVDAANGDYHLQPNSLGTDYAPAAGGVDLDGLPRDIDLPSIANTYGPRDIGAYEKQNLFRDCGTSDSLFCDGFGP